MHYKNGREAKVGDPVIGMTYNKSGIQVGKIKSITPDAKSCNCVIYLPSETVSGWRDVEYTQCDYLLHAEDVWHFVVGLAYSPTDQDFMAKIMNFSKWNAPIPELPPSERPVKH